LVIGSPVHDIAVAGLLEEVERDLAIRQPWAHPPRGRLPLVLSNRLGRRTNKFGFAGFIEMALFVRIRDTMAENLIATRAQTCRDIGAMLVDGRIHLGFDGDSQGIEEVKEPPDTDAIPIVTP
jgi:hypothetical protein